MTRTALALIGSVSLVLAAPAPAAPPPDLKKDGAFSFPQKDATVVCDAPDLRVSVWNDAASLYVQAVIWKDGDDALGETADGRKIGDTSDLLVDADADGKRTPKVDRSYSLNPWPRLPGLRYSVVLGAASTTSLQADSKGRGSIAYLPSGVGKARVDSFVVPLAEIKRKPGDKVRLAYYGSSPKPDLTVNSVGYDAKKKYYSFALPLDKYHEVTLSDRPASLDPKTVPDGRDGQVPLENRPAKPLPKVGAAPPEVVATDWVNADKAPTLAGLKGKVVVVEFWATWCGPCVEGIPHLNRLHDDLGPKGLVLLGFTDQSKAGVETFLKDHPVKYALGTGSGLASEYGVEGIPHAFVVGRDGKVAWHGSPNDKEFDKHVAAALDAK